MGGKLMREADNQYALPFRFVGVMHYAGEEHEPTRVDVRHIFYFGGWRVEAWWSGDLPPLKTTQGDFRSVLEVRLHRPLKMLDTQDYLYFKSFVHDITAGERPHIGDVIDLEALAETMRVYGYPTPAQEREQDA